MQKILFIFFLFLIGMFQFQLRYGKGGYMDDNHIRQEISNQTAIDQELKTRNNQMVLKISSLKGSSDAIEARARNELNLVKRNEILVLLPGNTMSLKKNN